MMVTLEVALAVADGRVTLTWVALSYVKPAATDDPNLTVLEFVKPVPVIVIWVPPVLDAPWGESDEITGR